MGPIGSGCFGDVYEAFFRGDRSKVAVKLLKKEVFCPEKAFQVMDTLATCKELNGIGWLCAMCSDINMLKSAHAFFPLFDFAEGS